MEWVPRTVPFRAFREILKFAKREPQMYTLTPGSAKLSGPKEKGMSNAGSMCFPGGAVIKNPPANAGDATEVGSIPGSGRSPGGGHGNPFQYSYLENPMDRGTLRATIQGWQRVRHGWSDSMQAQTIITQQAVKSGMGTEEQNIGSWHSTLFLGYSCFLFLSCPSHYLVTFEITAIIPTKL